MKKRRIAKKILCYPVPIDEKAGKHNSAYTAAQFAAAHRVFNRMWGKARRECATNAAETGVAIPRLRWRFNHLNIGDPPASAIATVGLRSPLGFNHLNIGDPPARGGGGGSCIPTADVSITSTSVTPLQGLRRVPRLLKKKRFNHLNIGDPPARQPGLWRIGPAERFNHLNIGDPPARRWNIHLGRMCSRFQSPQHR